MKAKQTDNDYRYSNGVDKAIPSEARTSPQGSCTLRPPECLDNLHRKAVKSALHFDPLEPLGMFPFRLRVKCDGTRAETRFSLSAKRKSPFKSARGVSSVDY